MPFSGRPAPGIRTLHPLAITAGPNSDHTPGTMILRADGCTTRSHPVTSCFKRPNVPLRSRGARFAFQIPRNASQAPGCLRWSGISDVAVLPHALNFSRVGKNRLNSMFLPTTMKFWPFSSGPSPSSRCPGFTLGRDFGHFLGRPLKLGLELPLGPVSSSPQNSKLSIVFCV